MCAYDFDYFGPEDTILRRSPYLSRAFQVDGKRPLLTFGRLNGADPSNGEVAILNFGSAIRGKTRHFATRQELSCATSGLTSDFRIADTSGASPDTSEIALLSRAQQSNGAETGPKLPTSPSGILRPRAAC
jgi:hypothetical protein